VRHLLVTNDFPPKVGGIQSYLWELWRRLPPERFAVLTSAHPEAAAFDAAQPFRVVRARSRVLLPTPAVRRQIEGLARELEASLVVLDPALPLGLLGPGLRLPYAVVLHGAEVAVPGRLPLAGSLLTRVLRDASHLVAAGHYPAGEASRAAGGRLPPCTEVPPGVDAERFRPLDAGERAAARRRFGFPVDARLVVSVSRLVPRKGMDVLVDAAARLAPGRPDLLVAIAGSGRDRVRIRRRVRSASAPVRLLGRVADQELASLYGCADVFAMLCRTRWRGLEQEGFGIVFLEAAACGVPQVAGDSGGAAEAVADGETGIVVRRPGDPGDVAAVLACLLDDAPLRARMGDAARRRAVERFSYERLAALLRTAVEGTSKREP
jgi:phosphatidylinositol alpha-1,6-mannosyltransferase